MMLGSRRLAAIGEYPEAGNPVNRRARQSYGGGAIMERQPRKERNVRLGLQAKTSHRSVRRVAFSSDPCLSFWVTDIFRLRSTLSTGREDGSSATTREGVPITFDAERRISNLSSARGPYDWPLFVGKSWPSDFQLKKHDRNQILDLKYVFTVEEVRISAGTFKTSRILRTAPHDRSLVWYEPKLALEVKRDWERYATHPLAPGRTRWKCSPIPSRTDVTSAMPGIAEALRDVPFGYGNSNRDKGGRRVHDT